MNRYGLMAQRHWQQTDPARYSLIPSPQAFFTSLGEEVESRIQELSDEIAGPDRPNEEYLAKVQRLTAARMQAEELALAELVWLTSPEETETPRALTADDPLLPLLETRQAIREIRADLERLLV